MMQNTEEQLLKSLERDPKNPKKLVELGKIYLSDHQIEDAVACFGRASIASPNYVPALTHLGLAYMRFGKVEAAQEVFRKVTTLDTNNSDALINYAGSLMALGEYEKAIACYEKALELSKKNIASATAGIAEALEKLGCFDEAFEKIEPLLGLQNPCPEIASVLAQLVLNHEQFSEYQSQAIQSLEAVVQSNSIERTQMARALFKLGSLYRKRQEYDRSFESFSKAHKILDIYYDLDELNKNIVKLKNSFSQLQSHQDVAEKYKNIFVVGMPRSGTSLVEKIVGVNEEVVSLGECNYFHHAVCEVSSDEDVNWGCKAIDEEHLPRVRSLYKQKYLVGHRPAKFICDKSLENVYLVGQILQVFPDARVVWTRRDLRDVCLSCYTSDFSGRHAYSHNLKTLGKYARTVEDLLVFWREKFPRNFHVVNYEEFVASPESGIRNLMDFLGFAWNDLYLEFHTSPNRVKTLSYNDVEKPVYRRAVGQWGHYKKYLEPLLEELKV